jgi:hypothetical protein
MPASSVIGEGNILEAAQSLVPKGLPASIRDDVVQEVALAILDGSLPLDSPSARVTQIIDREYRRSPLSFRHPLSLDAPDDTERTILETNDLHLPICNISEKYRTKVYPQDWYETKGHLKDPFGRRNWFHTNTLAVFRCYHCPETCGMGGEWAERRFIALHAQCPNCYNLMHMSGSYAGPGGVPRWLWICWICDAHVAYLGPKYWTDRPPSLIVNGKSTHRRSLNAKLANRVRPSPCLRHPGNSEGNHQERVGKGGTMREQPATKIVLTTLGTMFTVGIQRDDCDPQLHLIREGTLQDVLAAVPKLLEDAIKTWEATPMNPRTTLEPTPPPAAAKTPTVPPKDPGKSKQLVSRR